MAAREKTFHLILLTTNLFKKMNSHRLLSEFILKSLKKSLSEASEHQTFSIVINHKDYTQKLHNYLFSKIEDPNDPAILAKYKRYHQSHVDWVTARKAENDEAYEDYEIPSFEFNPYTEEMAKEEFDSSLKTTLGEMEKIKTLVERTINLIGDQWYGSKITISPALNFDSRYTTITETYTSSAEIFVGSTDPFPTFMIFQDEETGKVEAGDEMDAGDDDFFHDPQTESDYFNLIRFIKNPNAAQAKPKILRLYTARPQRDRHMYDGASTLPTNIFLTSSEYAAEGLAVELQGADKEARDIYLVKVDSRYVRITLDGPSEKQYQTVAPVEKTIPVKQIIRIA